MTDGRPVLVFDDDDATDYESVWPVLWEAGAPACLAVVPERVGGPGSLDRARLTELVDAGWEVATHGSRHRLLAPLRLARDVRAWSLVRDRYDALANAAVRSLPNPPGTPLAASGGTTRGRTRSPEGR